MLESVADLLLLLLPLLWTQHTLGTAAYFNLGPADLVQGTADCYQGKADLLGPTNQELGTPDLEQGKADVITLGPPD